MVIFTKQKFLTLTFENLQSHLIFEFWILNFEFFFLAKFHSKKKKEKKRVVYRVKP